MNPSGLIDRLKALRGARALAIATALGAGASLAQPPTHLWPLIAVGLSGLVWLLDAARETRSPGWSAFARGWAFGFGYFLAGMHWVGAAFLQVEGAAALLIPAVLALPAGLALFWGAAAALALRLWTPDARRIGVFAALFSVAELARSTLFTGLPWNLIGGIWPAGGAMSQMAAFVGVHGLTVITIALMAAPAALADRSLAFAWRVAPSLTAALAAGLMFGAGLNRLASAPPLAEAPRPVIRVVDPGLSQAEKWAPGGGDRVLWAYLEATAPAADSRADVVVWPEAALPGDLLNRGDWLFAIGETLGDRVLITGATRFARENGALQAFNSAVVLDGVGGTLRLGQIYDKHHLVPFGEYLPFWELYSAVPIAPLQQIGRGFTPGDRPARLIVPGAPPAAPLICYEAIFPGLSPRGEERAEWIVNVSIDSWYGKGFGPWQHANQARYRAIEEGLPLARAASGGVSGIFDAHGIKIAATTLNGGAVEAELPPALHETIYARFGAPLLVALILIFASFRLAPGPGRG